MQHHVSAGIFALALTGLVNPAHSQAQTGCAAFTRAIDDALKQMAAIDVESVGDNSAPRAALRAQEIGNQIQLISVNITLAQAQRCALPSTPVSENVYMVHALSCRTAQIREYKADRPECDRSRWSRNSAPPVARDSTAAPPTPQP